MGEEAMKSAQNRVKGSDSPFSVPFSHRTGQKRSQKGGRAPHALGFYTGCGGLAEAGNLRANQRVGASRVIL